MIKRVVGFYKPDQQWGQFSNWYIQPFTVDGMEFSCGEQYIMWRKATMFKDYDMAETIMRDTNPADMKRHGRMVKGFDNEVWMANILDIACDTVRNRVKCNPQLGKDILATGDCMIAECNPHDRLWGIGMGLSSQYYDTCQWRGRNILGVAYMTVRTELSSGDCEVQL